MAGEGEGIPNVAEPGLLEAVLESWERNNLILVNLLRLVPEGGLEARATEESPSVAQMFNHINHVRLVFVEEDAPGFATRPSAKTWAEEWSVEGDPKRIESLLSESARAVRDAVQNKIQTGGEMQLHYDHPVLFLQHMIWHEGYHQGQIKLALKLAGKPIRDEAAGPGTWGVWMNKTK